jgi:hypothetical protein
MISLKGITPTLAQLVGMTPTALYERQRALVRAGLLHPEPGRGPGSGVRATPESVAMLMIALLATGSLSETEQGTKALASLKSAEQRCPLTGTKTFASALAAIFASPEIAKEVCWVEAERGGRWAHAVIVYKPKPTVKKAGFKRSMFGNQRLGLLPGLSVKAELWLPFDKIAREFEAAPSRLEG